MWLVEGSLLEVFSTCFAVNVRVVYADHVENKIVGGTMVNLFARSF